MCSALWLNRFSPGLAWLPFFRGLQHEHVNQTWTKPRSICCWREDYWAWKNKPAAFRTPMPSFKGMFWAIMSISAVYGSASDVTEHKNNTTHSFSSTAHTLVVTFFLTVMALCIIGRALVLSLRHAGIFVALGAFWIFALTAVWLSSIAFGFAESGLFAACF